MNIRALKKNKWSRVRIRPVAKRFYGDNGPQLPPVDDTWIMMAYDSSVELRNTATSHGLTLKLDQVHHYTSDPERGASDGILILNTQIQFDAISVWAEPTARPGEALPDAFAGVRNWDRRNDAEYVQSLYRSPEPVQVARPVESSPAAGFLACIGFGLGLGLLIANAPKSRA